MNSITFPFSSDDFDGWVQSCLELINSGDYRKAGDLARQGIQFFSHLPIELGKACRTISLEYRKQYQFADAHFFIDQAIDLFKKTANSVQLAISLQNKATICYVEKDMDSLIEYDAEAIRLFEELLKSDLKTIDPAIIRKQLNRMNIFAGQYLAELFQPQKAEAALLKALPFLEKTDDDYSVALNQMAIIKLVLRHQPDEARKYVDQVIQAARLTPHPETRLREAYHTKGRIYLAQRRYKLAFRYFSKALKLTTNENLILNLKMNLAQALMGQRHYAEAEQLFKTVITLAKARHIHWLSTRINHNLAQLYLRTRRFPQAIEAYMTAIRHTEELQAMLIRQDDLKSGYTRGYLPIYEEFIDFCLKSKQRLGLALEYIERAKSRLLVDLLLRKLELKPVDTHEYERLIREINNIHQSLGESTPSTGERSTRFQNLVSQRNQLEQQVSQFFNRLQIAYTTKRKQDIFLDLEKLQAGLIGSIVEYFVTNGELFALVITSDKLTRFRLGSYRDIDYYLTAVIRDFRRFPRVRENPNGLETLRKRQSEYLQFLYQKIWAPLVDRLKSPVTIVPYGDLHYLPFHALGDVLDQFCLNYAPSSKIYQICRERAKNYRSQKYQAVLVGVPDPAIPQVEAEIEMLARQFDRVKVLIGDQATRTNIFKYSQQCDYLHISAHAYFRQDNSLFSAIKLHHEILTVPDIFQLKLTTRLVTLSACETARHQILAGDELIGLMRGFFYAGTPSILMSQWLVDDASAAQLMPEFYQHILSGHSHADALQKAQRSLRDKKNDAWYWAPFVLMGA